MFRFYRERGDNSVPLPVFLSHVTGRALALLRYHRTSGLVPRVSTEKSSYFSAPLRLRPSLQDGLTCLRVFYTPYAPKVRGALRFNPQLPVMTLFLRMRAYTNSSRHSLQPSVINA